MVRLARALMYLVIPAELLFLVLLLAGVDLPVPVIVAAETAVAVMLTVEVATAIHLFRTARRGGASRRAAAAAVADRIMPAPVRRMLRFELRIGASLVRWLLRRPDVPPGAVALPYAREQRAMLLLLVFAMAAEGVVVDVLLAAFDVATVVRVVVLALHVYSVYLGLGVYASCVARPHVVTDSELYVRYGVFFELRVPRRLISSVRLARNYNEPGMVTVADGALGVAVSAQTNLVAELSEPVTAVRPFGGRAEVTSVRLFADAPEAARAALTPEKGAPDMIM